MSNLTRAKVVVAGAGVAIWGFGIRMGDERLKWAGVALLGAAFLLRFVGPRQR